MSEVERRRQYTETRVLIDSGKILATTFDDGDLYFTGAQIELMRNLMQYANRIDSYVAEYEPGYYLTPDNDDWDDIQAIVADLEETLMGNPNTLFGYADTIRVNESKIGSLPGTIILESDVVPAGEIWVMGKVHGWNSVSVIVALVLGVVVAGTDILITTVMSPAIAQEASFDGQVVLKEGDKLRLTAWGCTSGDNVYLIAHGYKMLVPT